MNGQNIVQVKLLNQILILKTLLKQGPMSRKVLGELTELTPATSSTQIAELMAKDFVTESGLAPQNSGAGRPLVHLDLMENSHVTLGVTLNASKVSLGIISLKRRLLVKKTWALSASMDSQSILESIIAFCQTFLHDQYIPPSQLIGIGIGVASSVDTCNGIIRFAPSLQWHNISVVSFFKEQIFHLVALENNVRLMALGEKFYNSGRIILNGAIFNGLSGGDGNFGHISIIPEGTLCLWENGVV